MPAGTTADYEEKYFSIPKQGCEENKATAPNSISPYKKSGADAPLFRVFSL